MKFEKPLLVALARSPQAHVQIFVGIKLLEWLHKYRDEKEDFSPMRRGSERNASILKYLLYIDHINCYTKSTQCILEIC